jgi:hypothetical protein
MCSFLIFEVSQYKKNNFNSFDPYYENNEINDSLLNIGCGNSLFYVTLGCVCQKRDSVDFVTPIQGMYQ